MYKTEDFELLEINSIVFLLCHDWLVPAPIIERSKLLDNSENIFASFPSWFSKSNWTSWDKAKSWSFSIESETFEDSSDCKNFGWDTFTAVKEADNDDAKSKAIELEVLQLRSTY